MSIIKSVKAGKAGIPVTIDDFLRLGYSIQNNDKIGKNRTNDKSILVKGDHYLYIEEPKLVDEKEKVYWRYVSRISICKFYIENFADLELLEKYYSEYKPNKRRVLRDRMLDDPRTKEESTVWSTNIDGGTLMRNGKIKCEKNGKVIFRRIF